MNSISTHKTSTFPARSLLLRAHIKRLFPAFFVALCLFFIIPKPGVAQFGDPFELSQDTNLSVLSGGLTLLDYRYRSTLSDVPYLFDSSLYTFRLSSGNQAGITFRYGTDEVNYGSGQAADVRIINAAAELGGRKALYRGVGDSGTLIYIPVRVFADYFNMKNDFNPAAAEVFDSVVLNQLLLTGGLGLGFRYRTPRSSLLSNRVMIDAYATRSLGTSMQVDDDIFYGSARQDNIKAELTFLDLFSGYSFAIGYEFRNAVFRQEDFHEFISMLTESSGYDSEYFSHTITLGIRLSRR